MNENSLIAKPPIFSGIGVALVTIFNDAGDIDVSATADLASQLVNFGVRSVLVAGTTGEAAALEPEERARLVTAVKGAVSNRAVVLAGAGAPSARHAARLTRMVLDAGADAVLALSPPQSSDPRPYYETVAEAAGGAPLLAYHFPAASAPGIPVSVVAELPVVGLKDSSGDLSRLFEELDSFHGWLYTGSANLVLVAGALGCAGAILAVANVHPELAILAFAGDGKAQRQLAAAAKRTSGRWPHGLKDDVTARFGTSSTSRMG
ncbi:MAG TPA: dihydrodipicolinate synthase family protein [Acidimicrobiales bacterium]|nr:dihydrodipicolinate synthase family protein [Acidimicrobiales bacterium]